MAIKLNGKETYKGAVLKEESHYWMDGMEDVYAVVWDAETESVKRIQVGYYGSDGANLMGGSALIDATEDVKRAVRRSFKGLANKAFCERVIEYKNGLREGSMAQVVKDRKVQKGTVLEVFWIGEKPTYRARMYSWMDETETIAGCYDSDGNKVWIRADYLKVIDKIKSPNAKERRKFLKAYVNNRALEVGA